jgi:hypothetical protein
MTLFSIISLYFAIGVTYMTLACVVISLRGEKPVWWGAALGVFIWPYAFFRDLWHAFEWRREIRDWLVKLWRAATLQHKDL